jgi:ribonucleoside-diphosphate reductase alpha chain
MSPAMSVTRNDLSAIEQLKTWLTYQRHFCEHKPSITCTVRNEEWFEVGAFVYEHFDEMSGVSFLPHSDHTYQQAPYQEVGKSDYNMLLSVMPDKIDWSGLSEYEKDDNTVAMQTMACSGGVCEIVDLV